MRLDWIADNAAELAGLTLTHAGLAAPAVLAATVIALPLGWAAHRARRWRDVVVTAAGLVYAVPSLVLFILMPLFLDTSIIAPANVVVALTAYGVALLVRTCADGFDSVDATARTTAEALGFSPAQRVLQVELPLAGPVILGGVRVVSASTIALVSVGALIGVESLGTLFTEGFARSFPTEILTGVIGTVVLALIFDAVLVAAGRVLMPWGAKAASK